MDKNPISTHAAIEDNYWWFIGRRAVIDQLADKYVEKKENNIIDWGCGTGGNFAVLQKYGKVLGVDSSEEAIAYSRKRNISNLKILKNIDELVLQEKYDLFTNFDVLEHMVEDEAFLRSIHNVLKPGGFVLVTVPAYMFLWSPLDEVLGHVRRYSRGELVDKFERCGFKVLRASYFVTILSPAFVLVRMVQKTRKSSASLENSVVRVPSVINRFFVSLIKLEARIIRSINLPFGTSIILLAKVPEPCS